MQVVFAKFPLRKHAWRNPKEGRVGCLHQDIFTRKVTDIAFTSDFCNNYSHSASPASLYLMSPRPRSTRPRVPYLMSWSPSSRVPKSQVPTHASLCPRPLVPVPLLYTAQNCDQLVTNATENLATRITWLVSRKWLTISALPMFWTGTQGINFVLNGKMFPLFSRGILVLVLSKFFISIENNSDPKWR